MQVKRGFTIVELLTVIALITIMTGILLSRVTNTTSRAKVELATQEILSLFRATRQKAVAIKAVNTSFPGYGVAFSRDGTNVDVFIDCTADDNADRYLTDTDTWSKWEGNNCGGVDTSDQGISLSYGTRITNITVRPTQGAAPIAVTDVSVQFLRPEPTVWISYKTSSGAPTQVSTAGTVEMTVSDSTGTDSQIVRIEASGLVSVI